MPHVVPPNAVQPLCAAACLLAVALWSTPAQPQRIPEPWNSRAAPKAEAVGKPAMPDIGRADAAVNIVAFSDYHCPYCRQLSKSLQQLLDEHPDRIAVTYRHLALSPQSRAMSEATLCAGDQGRYDDYHQLVFGTPGLAVEDLPRLAEQLGLDGVAFRECVTSHRHASRIDADIRDGERLNVQVTPTFFVNGERIVGSLSIDKLRKKIDKLVSAAARRDGAP